VDGRDPSEQEKELQVDANGAAPDIEQPDRSTHRRHPTSARRFAPVMQSRFSAADNGSATRQQPEDAKDGSRGNLQPLPAITRAGQTRPNCRRDPVFGVTQLTPGAGEKISFSLRCEQILAVDLQSPRLGVTMLLAGGRFP